MASGRHRTLAAGVVLLFACGPSSPSAPSAVADTSLAAMATTTDLDASLQSGVLTLRLEPAATASAPTTCPRVHATATVNGVAMELTSAGDGQAVQVDHGCDGSGASSTNPPSEWTVSCTAPTFRLVLDAAAASGPIEVRISDESQTWLFRSDFTAPSIALDPPGDGALHVGTWTRVATTVGVSPSAFVGLYTTPDGYDPVFTAEQVCPTVDVPDGGADGGTTCDVELVPGGFAFLVPDVPPQPGYLDVTGLLFAPVNACQGPAACGIDARPPLYPRIATHVVH